MSTVIIYRKQNAQPKFKVGDTCIIKATGEVCKVTKYAGYVMGNGAYEIQKPDGSFTMLNDAYLK